MEMSSLEKLIVNSYWDYLFHKFFALNKLLREIIIEEPNNILEVGSGIGYTTSFLAKRFPDAQITAIDYDESQTEKAQRRQRALETKNVHFLQGNATKLSFPDNTFDACFASLMFHHIPNYQDAIQEIHRVLCQGSYLYVIEIPHKFLNRVFSKSELTQELEHSGFTIKRSQDGVLLIFLACKKV